jgi:hypothetical protein
MVAAHPMHVHISADNQEVQDLVVLDSILLELRDSGFGGAELEGARNRVRFSPPHEAAWLA